MANESIEGKAHSLGDILATEFKAYYQIPIYQRPYQWTEENCEKLLDDLLSSYEYYKESDYFCGSLVLIAIGKDSETNATTYDIVDGQQRLSTFILLAKVLVTLYDKDLNEHCKTSRGFLEKSKVELLKKLAKEHEQEEFVSRWNALRQKCSENESKFPKRKENKREKNAAETLFSWYLTYLNPVTSGKNMEERLADQFERLNKTPLEYLKSIEDFYNAYCGVLEMQDRHAHLLSYLASDFWRVILCTSILHHYSDQDIEALKELLVKFYYQNWVAEQKEPKKQTNCNIIKALKEKKSVKDIASIVKEYLDKNKITQNFREKLKDDHLYEKHKKSSKNSWLRPILILVEYSMSDDPKPKRIETDDFHVEHILPQKPTLSSQWAKDFSEEERELYTHSLANLTLLGGKKNTKASNLDFKDKKKIYMGEEIRLSKKKTFRVITCYKMTIDIAHHYTEWTPKSLEKREKELIEIIESTLEL